MLLKIALVGLAVASIASWLGATIEAADLLSHFRVHFAAATVALMLALLAAREPWLALVAALLVAVNLAGSLVYPYRETNAALPAANERTLKLIAFNTRWAADNALAIVEFLDRERPDIVVLQELTPAKRDVILRRVAYYLPWQEECSDDLFCRVGLLSRYPWKEARTAGGEGELAVAYADFGDRLGGLRVIGTHLSRPWPWWDAHRRQVGELIPLIKNAPGPATVLGDFNATPWSRTIRRIGEETDLRPAGWYSPSWPLRLSRLGEIPLLPQLQLDHLLLPKGVRLLSIEHGPDLGSDHLPIIAHIAVPVR